MRGIDGLKTGSPLGVEPKGEGITGDHGYSTGAAPPRRAPAATTDDARRCRCPRRARRHPRDAEEGRRRRPRTR